MPRLPRSASKAAKQEAMADEMHKFQAGELHSGASTGPVVQDRKQAVAISLGVSGQSRKKRAKKKSLPWASERKRKH